MLPNNLLKEQLAICEASVLREQRIKWATLENQLQPLKYNHFSSQFWAILKQSLCQEECGIGNRSVQTNILFFRLTQLTSATIGNNAWMSLFNEG